MSSRTTERQENLAKKFLTWKNVQTVKVIDGEEYKKITGGDFIYYDKEAINPETNEAGMNITVSKPFKFAVLHTDCKSFKGWDKVRERNTWSNEVFKPNQVVTVKSKEGVLLTFPYKDYQDKTKKEALKATLKDLGAKYCQSIYIAVQGDEGWEIWNLQLTKAPLTGGNDMKNPNPDDINDGWFSFSNRAKNKIFSHMVVVDDVKMKKVGDVAFSIPVYSLGEPIGEEDGAELLQLTKNLEAYLEDYAKNSNKAEDEVPATVDSTDDDYTS